MLDESQGKQDVRDEAAEAASAAGDIDWALLEYLQTLTPTERFLRHEQALELVRALRQAGTNYYGFDPGSTEATGGEGR